MERLFIFWHEETFLEATGVISFLVLRVAADNSAALSTWLNAQTNIIPGPPILCKRADSKP